MILEIDFLKNEGPQDYTNALDASFNPKITRRLNKLWKMELWLAGKVGEFVVPTAGAWVTLRRNDGAAWFTGILDSTPQQELAGLGKEGAIFRYRLIATSQGAALNRKHPGEILPPANRTAGDRIRRLTQQLMPDIFELSQVQDVALLPAVELDSTDNWSDIVGDSASMVRAVCSVQGKSVKLAPLGETKHVIRDTDPSVVPGELHLVQTSDIANDVIVFGGEEPQMYVKDYFVADGETLRFSMSQQPFFRPSVTLVEEEFRGSELGSNLWTCTGTFIVSDGKVIMGAEPATIALTESLELGGSLSFEHGSLKVIIPGDGIIGGLYHEQIDASRCLAGFSATNNAGAVQLAAIVNGVVQGTAMTLDTSHRYELTTRMYCPEVSCQTQTYRSSRSVRTGSAQISNCHFVLSVQDIDPAIPASRDAEAIVLWDGSISNAPAFITYALVNNTSFEHAISYTRIRKAMMAEVQTITTDGAARTRLIGGLTDGAECTITSGPAVYFYSKYKQASGTQVTARYRASGKAKWRVEDQSSISRLANVADDGRRSRLIRLVAPIARTSEDCRVAAEALLDDLGQVAWSGSYATWSDLLPNGATDVFPGDVVSIDAQQRQVSFDAIVRGAELEVQYGRDNRAHYFIEFSNESSELIAIQTVGPREDDLCDISPTERGVVPSVQSLSDAEVIAIADTTITVDVGLDLTAGGVEVRSEGDFGWGLENDRNLVGRFMTRVFTLPKIERGEDYYLRMYDGAAPPNYSPYTTLLHVDVKSDTV